MKKNEKTARKSGRFFGSACLALCLIGYGGSAINAEPSYVESTLFTIQANERTMKEVFSYIEKNSQFIFVYHGSNINVNQKVSVDVKNRSVEDILHQMFDGTDMEYLIDGRQIIVRKKTSSNSAQKKEKKMAVAGNVKDQKGEPLIGVNVIAKGTALGSITDMNGNFSLTNVPSNAVISVSYIGYQTVEVPAQEKLSITLKEDSKALEEVVVIGYGVQKKVDLSGAVAVVPTKVLQDRPVLNVGQALQGSVANMNVTIGSGQATDSPSFNIRGTTSINGGEPLVVIDGVVSTAEELNRMNPTDIGSISVLKDAASAAIYGSRAAFGVILVTTKTAGQEKLTINYNNNFAMRKLSSVSDIITDPYIITQARNDFYYPWGVNHSQEELDYAKRVSEDPNTSPYYLKPDGTYAYFAQTDWFDEAYKNLAFSTSHNVDISGKTSRLNYYFSGGYNFQDGMISQGTDKFNRYNLRSKLDFKLTDRWHLGNNTSLVISDYDAPYYLGSDYYWAVNRRSPLRPVRNPDGSYTEDGAAIFGRLSEGGRRKENKTTVSTQFTTKFDIIKDVLFINGSFAYVGSRTNKDGAQLSVPYRKGPETAILYQNSVSSAYFDNTESSTLTFDAYATFHKTFKGKHDFTAMMGYNQESWRQSYEYAKRNELITAGLPTPNLATGDMSVTQTIQELSFRSVFGRLNYTYDNRYILAFNARYDGTSRFPTNSRFAFNPSGSAAWVISQERFFEPLRNVVSFLKLRFSYGSLGNQHLSNYYPYLATMSSGKTSVILDGKQPIYVSAPGLVSGNLTWETVTTSDWGMDANFFDNRLTITVDGYIRRTKDMLRSGAKLPSVLGTSVPLENAADLKTTGWDLTINWRDQFKLANKPFNYGLSFNIGDSRSWITKYANETGDLNDYYVGKEIGEIWGLINDGFFTSQEDIDNSASQTEVDPYPGTPPMAPGDVKYKDLNNDNKINKGANTLSDHGDYTVIGNTRSRYAFGFTLNGDWNGFDLSLFVQGIMKKDYYPTKDPYFWGMYYDPWTNLTSGNYNDHWTEDNTNAYFPRIKSYQAYVSGRGLAIPQTRYLQNAAYARLKNLTVGYTLPNKWTSKLNISRLRVFFSGDNLCEVTGLYKYYKMDPECLGGQIYPLQRSYSFGLNVTF